MDIYLSDKIMGIRKKHFDTVHFFADLENNNFIVENNDILPKQLMHENCDLLKELYIGSWVDEKDIGKIINLYERIIQGTKEPIQMDEVEVQILIKDRTGQRVMVSVLCYLETNNEGIITSYVGQLRPLRKKELENREILQSFSNDKNPSIFINRIAKFQAANPDRYYAYIQLDICKFKYINEKYGCVVGDNILQYISDTLDVMCDDEHLHCRLTADLFQVVTYYNSREEILEFIDMLDARLHRYGDIRFTMAYGVSIAPGTSTTYRKHGDEAALARIKSKSSVLNKALFYEDTLMDSIKIAGEIEEEEEEALKNGEFHIFLQPKYFYDKHQARIVGAEALVRWIDKNGKCKSPMEFIPIFEKNGFIYKLDCFMWEGVCKLIRKWLDEGKKPIPVSVNVSRSYLQKVDVVKYIQGLIEKYQIPIELLQLEITETTENKETMAYANKLKDSGFILMMDDFGSGYSSLSMLKDTPFDVLKMDRYFLDECLESDNGKTIVSYVISMANDLGLKIIAEGVETRAMADFLYEKGCNTLQGFYFSKPVPVEVFEKLRDEQ